MSLLINVLRENGHMVIVVAEGAGQELMETSTQARDASGNQLLRDIGLWLSQKLKDHYSKTKNESLNLKYIGKSTVPYTVVVFGSLSLSLSLALALSLSVYVYMCVYICIM
ncbi:hypothetical protein KP509_1Z328200 [Ceratopteris richardii]|nr:hypothetical protein KP509_1Z328200 [Ceratopteris richardii]KAH6554525.1 hypothetical protein KP509_1Z328200 [Ceratopteris richardii]